MVRRPSPTRYDTVLALQRQAGNGAVASLLALQRRLIPAPRDPAIPGAWLPATRVYDPPPSYSPHKGAVPAPGGVYRHAADWKFFQLGKSLAQWQVVPIPIWHYQPADGGMYRPENARSSRFDPSPTTYAALPEVSSRRGGGGAIGRADDIPSSTGSNRSRLR